MIGPASTLDADGDRIVVGGDSGIAVFDTAGNGSWSETKLPGVDGEFLRFVVDVAVSGDRIVVGVRVPSEAYVFELVDGAWGPPTLLEPPDDIGRQQFGTSVDIVDDRIFVGSTAGVAVFDHSAGGWTSSTIPEPRPGLDDRFGRSVEAVDGDTVLIGSPFYGRPPFDRGGAAHLYRRLDDGSWRPAGWFDARNTVQAGWFDRGESVLTAAENRVVVASPDRGVVDTYTLTGPSGWVRQRRLGPQWSARRGYRTDAGDFGQSIVVAGGRLWVGAPAAGPGPDSTTPFAVTGAVFGFDLGPGASPNAAVVLAPPDLRYGARFGRQMAVAGDRLVVLAAASGSVYVFDPSVTGPLCLGMVPTIVGAGAIAGTPGPDVILGSDGNDRIDGLGGNDVICGGEGDDELIGGPGWDRLDGGTGADLLDGGPQRDAVSYADRRSPVTVTIDDTLPDGEVGEGDRLIDIERVVGTEFDDVLVGAGADDELIGLSGDDRLIGGNGSDALYGGAGDDLLDGGPLRDRFYPGEGADVCVVGDPPVGRPDSWIEVCERVDD